MGSTSPPVDEARGLAAILEAGEILLGQLEMKRALARCLELLIRHHLFFRAAVLLVDEETQRIELTAQHGYGESETDEDGYKPGQGIPGRVVRTGKPVVVPKVSLEPLAIERPGGRDAPVRAELSHICVPIRLHRKTVGALAVDLKYGPDRDYRQAERLVSLIATMIAQAIKSHLLVERDQERLRVENTQLKQELRERYDFGQIIGNSNPLRLVYEQVTQVARSNTTVLLRGESGTGKELIAHAIHYNSLRATKPFVKVSCAALPETLIESELFGYEKGAFTGAQQRKKGRFELADGGTLFLDEIGDLNLSTQIKLLRVLQEREFERLGGTETIKSNVRLVAATNKELEQAIGEGQFRQDLYYRLNVFSIFVPPLRDRKADVLLLADHFLEKYAREQGKRIKRISTPAIDMLANYHWPGNVRELENIIERAVLVCETGVIHGHHLPPTLQTAEGTGTVPRLSLEASVEAFERDLIQDALKTTRGNRKRAAQLLGTTERIIGYKVGKYGIDCGRFRG
jgi:Nif-specific regulatory protein